MPRNHTDSTTVEYHEDGTWTETNIITYSPPSKSEKITAWTALGLITALAVAPLAIAVVDVTQEWREERKQRKLDKKSEK